MAIAKKDVPHCLTPQCNGLVKPDIVFFGEPLPEAFHRNRALPSEADLCIVMGTSLTVQPFASLPAFCSEGVPRVLINLERVGGLGSRSDDVLLLGDCDAGVRKLAAALGWEAELDARWKETLPEGAHDHAGQDKMPKPKDKELDEQVADLTAEIDKALEISSLHTSHLREHLISDTDVANFPVEGAQIIAEKGETTDEDPARNAVDEGLAKHYIQA